jgi:hypothetical protein
MVDGATTETTLSGDTGRGGRASGKELMARPRYQDGSVFVRGKRKKVWVLRWREDVPKPDGTVTRVQRAETLGPVSKITRQKARAVLQDRVGAVSQGQRRPQAIMTLETSFEWRGDRPRNWL